MNRADSVQSRDPKRIVHQERSEKREVDAKSEDLSEK